MSSMLTCSFFGSTETIKDKLATLVETTKADELMVVAAIWDHQARIRSFKLLAQAVDQAAEVELKLPKNSMSA